MKTLKRDGSLEMAFDRMMLKLEELKKRAAMKEVSKQDLQSKPKKSTKNSSKKS